MLEVERCRQNVYTSFLLLEYLPIYLSNRKNGSRCWKRNSGYKMCIHRSCLWSSYRFTFETKKKVTSDVRGTVYTKCVYILPVSGVSADLTFKKIKGYWCWKRNGVYKMCIHRSCFWSRWGITFSTEKRLLAL